MGPRRHIVNKPSWKVAATAEFGFHLRNVKMRLIRVSQVLLPAERGGRRNRLTDQPRVDVGGSRRDSCTLL